MGNRAACSSSLMSRNMTPELPNLPTRSRAWGESENKMGLIGTLLTLVSRLEENKLSDVGCNEGG